MYSSDLGFFLGPATPGAAGTLLNSSACTIDSGGTSVSFLPASGSLRIVAAVMMKAPMVE